MPSTLTEDDFAEEAYVPGLLVWARSANYPSWPAMIEDDPDDGVFVKEYEDGGFEYHVTYLTDIKGKALRDWVPEKRITPFLKPPKTNKVKKTLQKSLKHSTKLAEEALKMTLAQRLQKFSFGLLSNQKFPPIKRGTMPNIPAASSGTGQPTVGKATKDTRADPSDNSRARRSIKRGLNGAPKDTEKVVALQDTSNDASTSVSGASSSTFNSSDKNESPSITPIPEEDASSSSISVDPPSVSGDASSGSHAPTSQLPDDPEMDPERAALLAQCERELDEYVISDTESLPDDDIPEPWKSKTAEELFSEIDPDSGSEDDMDIDEELLFPKIDYMDEGEKYICDSESDIWDIHNPRYQIPNYRRIFGFQGWGIRRGANTDVTKVI